MKFYTRILVWENNRRLEKLAKFRDLIVEYFNNSRAEWMVDGRIEEEAARIARVKINRSLDEAHNIILYSGINPAITWSPPPAIGGYVRNIDLIENIFNLGNFQISADEVLNFIDRSIGIYENNHRSSLIRTLNPFFYVGLVFDAVTDLPFMVLGKLGFNKEKAETSIIGKIIKGILYLITVIAAFLTILQLLDFLDPVKQFVHSMIDFN